MKTLNDQHRLIKEGKGHKGVFLKEAKAQFPQWIRNAATFKETASILKNKGIINENVVGLEPINQLVSPPKQSYEVAFENYLEEAKKKDTADAKAEEKETSKQVKDAESKNFDRKNMENPDNLIFDQIMTGYYYELKNPKNSKKTVDELKSIVFKNLAKNPIYYTEKGQFGEEIGYETEAPGLGKGRQVKNVGIGGGYGTPTKKKFPEGEVGTGYLEVPKKIKGSGLKVKNVTTLNENKLRKVVNNLIREELNENKLKESYEEYEEKKYAEDLALRYRSRGDWPDDISEEEFRDLMGKYDLKLYDDDNFTDPAGGSGLASYLEESHQPGDKVIYKGTKYEVVDEDEFIITLKDEKGNITKQNYNQFKQGETTPKDTVSESKLRKAINTIVRQQIQENVQKELLQIDKEAQFEILASKLAKIGEAIEKRTIQLERIDEDEDLKNLTDKKKLKALAKDIKILKKAQAKIEKELAKKDKSDKPQPEIIDEDEEIIDEGGFGNEISEEDINEGPKADSAEEIKTSWEDIKKTIDDIEGIDLFEEDEEETPEPKI